MYMHTVIIKSLGQMCINVLWKVQTAKKQNLVSNTLWDIPCASSLLSNDIEMVKQNPEPVR